MTERERLIELLKMVEYQYTETHSIMTQNVADFLLQRGVIVPPCKVGETVWSFLEDNRLFECEVKQFYIDKKEIGMTYEPKAFRGRMYGVNIRAFGKTVFLTREDAEAVLKARENE